MAEMSEICADSEGKFSKLQILKENFGLEVQKTWLIFSSFWRMLEKIVKKLPILLA